MPDGEEISFIKKSIQMKKPVNVKKYLFRSQVGMWVSSFMFKDYGRFW